MRLQMLSYKNYCPEHRQTFQRKYGAPHGKSQVLVHIYKNPKNRTPTTPTSPSTRAKKKSGNPNISFTASLIYTQIHNTRQITNSTGWPNDKLISGCQCLCRLSCTFTLSRCAGWQPHTDAREQVSAAGAAARLVAVVYLYLLQNSAHA